MLNRKELERRLGVMEAKLTEHHNRLNGLEGWRVVRARDEGERGATPEQPITGPTLARPDDPWAVSWWKFQEVVDERDRLAEVLENQRKGWDDALDEHARELRAGVWKLIDFASSDAAAWATTDELRKLILVDLFALLEKTNGE